MREKARRHGGTEARSWGRGMIADTDPQMMCQ